MSKIVKLSSKEVSVGYSRIYGYESKQAESKRKVGGFIATTHLDQGSFKEELGVLVRDKIEKETLEAWAKELNEGVPRANKVSVNHDREDRVVMGVAEKDSAKVVQLPDGEYGLYVDTLLDHTHPNFEAVNTRIDLGTLDSFSIEYVANEYQVDTNTNEDYVIRHLLPGTELYGYTLASRPMNEWAVMTVKEVFAEKAVNKQVEEIHMETKETPAPEVKEHVPDADLKAFQAWKELQTKQAEESRIREMKENVLKEIKESLKDVKVESKIMQNSKPVEVKELNEFKQLCAADTKLSMSSIQKIAGKIADMTGMTAKGRLPGTRTAEERLGHYHFDIKQVGAMNLLEYKGLGITTNQNTDTDYLLSAAELSDVFDPVIYSAINQVTNTWNLLQKDDFSSKGNNQVQFTLLTTANAATGFYAGNAVATAQSGRLKYQTKFKKAAVGIAIDGDMIAAARGGPIGDVFAQEVADSTRALLKVINAALFAEVGLETATAVIGFEYITDGAGNGTMYSLTRSAANRLLADAATDTYINQAAVRISIDNLRLAIEQAKEEGADMRNLVLITHPRQVSMFKGIYDGSQRMVPTSSRFGFEGRPEFEGIPIFDDVDCNTDDWWLVDLETHRVAVWVPPTLEMLGKTDDSTQGFVKTYFCTYNRAPRRMVQIYGCATS